MMNKKIAVFGIGAGLLFAASLSAQVSAVVEGGSNAGLGYTEPHVAVGAHADGNIVGKLGVEGEARYSPDNKRVTGNGNELILSSRAFYLIGSGIGLSGGAKTSYLWTNRFNKQSWNPTLGMYAVLGEKDILFLDYVFPTGCEWATHKHPCDIQSNRLHGIEFALEHDLSDRVVAGFKADVFTFKDQANQWVVSHRTEHTTLVGTFFLRVRLS